MVGRRTVLVVTVLLDGRPLAGATVEILGAGISTTRVTNQNGVVTVTLRPGSVGVIRIQVRTEADCPALSRLLQAVSSFRPPRPKFTG
jgi:hypothetical protein